MAPIFCSNAFWSNPGPAAFAGVAGGALAHDAARSETVAILINRATLIARVESPIVDLSREVASLKLSVVSLTPSALYPYPDA
jgi:hypothetical protein